MRVSLHFPASIRFKSQLAFTPGLPSRFPSHTHIHPFNQTITHQVQLVLSSSIPNHRAERLPSLDTPSNQHRVGTHHIDTMSQHPLAPQRFKRPRNWLAPSQLVHDLDDRQHCRTCQRCKIDREEREQEKAKRVKAEAEADKKFHQGLDPNHREKCDLCRTIYDRHAFHKLKEAHNKGIEASHEANSAWIAPHEVGCESKPSFHYAASPLFHIYMVTNSASSTHLSIFPCPQPTI